MRAWGSSDAVGWCCGVTVAQYRYSWRRVKVECGSAFSRRDASEVYVTFGPGSRARGKPGARCTRGLVCKVHKENAHEHTGSAEAIRLSLRDGFTAYFVLSPVTGLSCHRRPAM